MATKIIALMLQRVGHRKMLEDDSNAEASKIEKDNPRARQTNMVFYRLMTVKEVDGTKPDFSWKDRNYTVDLSQMDYVDKKGRPVFKYDIEIATPLPSNTPLHLIEEVHAYIKVQKKDGKGEEYKAVTFKMPSSQAQHWLFIRRTMAAILSSATKLKADTPTWVLVGAGIAIGAMIMAVAYPHVFPLPTIIQTTTTSTTTGYPHP